MTAPPTLVVATDGDLNAPDDDDNDVWNIERIHHAERVGNRYKLWIKWRGSATTKRHERSAPLTSRQPSPGPRWRHELVKETPERETRIQ